MLIRPQEAPQMVQSSRQYDNAKTATTCPPRQGCFVSTPSSDTEVVFMVSSFHASYTTDRALVATNIARSVETRRLCQEESTFEKNLKKHKKPKSMTMADEPSEVLTHERCIESAGSPDAHNPAGQLIDAANQSALNCLVLFVQSPVSIFTFTSLT